MPVAWPRRGITSLIALFPPPYGCTVVNQLKDRRGCTPHRYVPIPAFAAVPSILSPPVDNSVRRARAPSTRRRVVYLSSQATRTSLRGAIRLRRKTPRYLLCDRPACCDELGEAENDAHVFPFRFDSLPSRRRPIVISAPCFSSVSLTRIPLVIRRRPPASL
ncbi:hypothetical protein BKA70DRAFT_1283977, partial [Coprinopsis sp. MPI-PUGE-AT-0042]